MTGKMVLLAGVLHHRDVHAQADRAGRAATLVHAGLAVHVHLLPAPCALPPALPAKTLEGFLPFLLMLPGSPTVFARTRRLYKSHSTLPNAPKQEIHTAYAVCSLADVSQRPLLPFAKSSKPASLIQSLPSKRCTTRCAEPYNVNMHSCMFCGCLQPE